MSSFACEILAEISSADGANNYLGVAYVRNNDLVKARAQLATLESICGNKDCDEYKLLDKAIADYKPQ